ncbi:BRO1 domain-containing protein [Aphelenchoides fujianensis]|nr:BRO1 domain-containing protein [Aphelenchoides fujianensis]
MEEMVVERWLRVEPNERPLALRPLHVLAPDWGTDCRHFVDERLFFLPGEHELLDDALLQMDDVRRRAFASRPRGQPVSVILLMRQYFDAFSSLSTRLPMDEATCRLDFAWDFSALAREIDLRIVRHDAEFEKACVLYTIAAHQSLQAAKIRFVDVHSLWRRALLLQDAAELLQSAKGVMEAAGHVEWPPCFNAPVLDALSWTMAAEAFGCLFERRWKSDDSTLEDRLAAASETQRVVSLAKKADELMPAAFTDFYRHVQRQFAHLISTFKKQFTPLPEGARREAIAAEPAPALLDVRPAVFPLDEDAGDPFEFVGDWRKREEIRPVCAAVEAELRLLVGRLEKAAYDLYNDSVIYALFVEDLREKTPLPALIEQKRELLVQSGGSAAFADRAKMLEEANTKMKQVVDYFVYNVEEAAAAGGPPAPQSVQKKLRKMQRNLEKSCKWMDDLRARVQATMCGLEVLGRSKEELSAVIPEWRDDVQPILSEGDVHELRDQVTAVHRVVDKADELIYESNKVFWTDEPVEFATFDEWKAAVERQHAAAADLTTAAEEQLTAAANVRPLFAATVERLAAEGFRPELSDRHAHLAGLAYAFIGASHLQRAMDEGFRVLAQIIASFRSINPATFVEAEEVVEVAEVVRSRG